MKNEQAQRRIIAAAFFSLKQVAWLASPYEQALADHYIEGILTIHQSLELLEKYQHRQMSQAGR